MAADSIAFGITLDQFDALDRLVRTIAAHGDMIATAAGARLDAQTLPALGDAIYDAARAVRGILDQVGEQRLAGAAVGTRAPAERPG
ncbi:hypothetical protein JR065_20700 [Xanthomonas sp. AmX2]|uniref:hypothetical protein n=1 Tax=Xanthomonas sp. TaxID=29446 RepID=UPI00197CFB31|nr:hypothetical protein [Xanthomonas sp.]MBN6152753.1 hypothetical protein [Xanthomonas sp.]